jgi:hypothetical protein
MSSIDGVLLLKAAEDYVGSKGRGVHGGKKRRLKMVMVIAKCVQEQDDFDSVEIDGPHVGDLCVHGKNLIGAIAEWCLMAIMEVKSLFEQKELGMCAEFLVALLECHEDKVGGGEIGNHIIVQFRDTLENESAEGAVIRLPYVVHLGVENGIWLRQGAFEPLQKT